LPRWTSMVGPPLAPTAHGSAKRVPRVVLTGGPCAGKTTALVQIKERLTNLGLHVVTVPENATQVFENSGGYHADWATQSGRQGHVSLQRTLLRFQMDSERHYTALAELHARTRGTPAVLLCDRGTLDGKAFCEDTEWDTILLEEGLTEQELITRYDIVCHLVTAADGAAHFYEFGEGSRNPSRFHNAQQALESDRKGLRAWGRHPDLRVVDNSTGFELKVQRVLRAICAKLDLPQPQESFQRMTLSGPVDERVFKDAEVAFRRSEVWAYGDSGAQGAWPWELRKTVIRGGSGSRAGAQIENNGLADAGAEEELLAEVASVQHMYIERKVSRSDDWAGAGQQTIARTYRAMDVREFDSRRKAPEMKVSRQRALKFVHGGRLMTYSEFPSRQGAAKYVLDVEVAPDETAEPPSFLRPYVQARGEKRRMTDEEDRLPRKVVEADADDADDWDSVPPVAKMARRGPSAAAAACADAAAAAGRASTSNYALSPSLSDPGNSDEHAAAAEQEHALGSDDTPFSECMVSLTQEMAESPYESGSSQSPYRRYPSYGSTDDDAEPVPLELPPIVAQA
jgi:hypothetical protein